MNGEILVDSEPGKGSVFTVRIPQERVGSDEIGMETAAKLQSFTFDKKPQADTARFEYEPMPYGKVLVVDDIEMNLYVAKGLMEPYGLKIETARDGYEVIERIQNKEQYDIIYMDHMMPKMDGIEATKIIRNLGYTGPVIALTASTLVGQAEEFINNGFNGFLSKPIDIRQLDDSLHEMIYDKQPYQTIEAARAKKEKKKAEQAVQTIAVNPELVTTFIKEAEAAYKVMEAINDHKFRRDDDIRIFTFNAHAMKSALMYINEVKLANELSTLEQAGREKDVDVLLADTPEFLAAFRSIIDKNKQADDYEPDLDEDHAFLKNKLALILTACSEYDSGSIRSALTELSGKHWRKRTNQFLDSLKADMLNSDYEHIETAVLGFYASLT
jgi:CheY-like chemotaxis protein